MLMTMPSQWTQAMEMKKKIRMARTPTMTDVAIAAAKTVIFSALKIAMYLVPKLFK